MSADKAWKDLILNYGEIELVLKKGGGKMVPRAQFSFAIAGFKQYKVDKIRNSSVRDLPT